MQCGWRAGVVRMANLSGCLGARRCFKEVTCAAVTVRHLSYAVEYIDFAVSQALLQKKPVLIQARAPCHTAPTPTPPAALLQELPSTALW